MSTHFDIKVTDEGVFVPSEIYRDFGEVEVIQGENYVLIKPRNLTARFSGFIRPRISIEKLHEDYELSLITGE